MNRKASISEGNSLSDDSFKENVEYFISRAVYSIYAYTPEHFFIVPTRQNYEYDIVDRMRATGDNPNIATIKFTIPPNSVISREIPQYVIAEIFKSPHQVEAVKSLQYKIDSCMYNYIEKQVVNVGGRDDARFDAEKNLIAEAIKFGRQIVENLNLKENPRWAEWKEFIGKY